MMLGRTALGFWVGAAVIVLSNSQLVNLKNLSWGPGVWLSEKSKIVIVPQGVSVGSLLPGSPAITWANDWGGQLTIIVAGSVEGAGGDVNGGTGGNAIDAVLNVDGVTEARLVVNSTAVLAGGGGGGAKGGNGGTGQYPYTVTEGPLFQDNVYKYQWSQAGFGLTKIYWGGAVLIDEWNPGGNYRYIGGAYYYRGSHVFGENYTITRQYTAYQATAGGVGPNGGRGAGYAQSAGASLPPVAGGTNAGASGSSGAGGARGESGAAGTAGSAGNVGAGQAPGSPGLAGYAINNPTNLTLVNNGGTILTRP